MTPAEVAADAASGLRREAIRLRNHATWQRGQGHDAEAVESDRLADEKDAAATFWEGRRW